MTRWRRLCAAAAAVVLAAGCAHGPNYAELDEQMETVAIAIGWPRQYSAAGFARAALATNWGRSGGFTVVEMTELDAPDYQDPLARLMLRVHEDAYDSGWTHRDAYTVCYLMEFNRYGIIGHPERLSCPEHTTPITPPPRPRWAEPATYDQALRTVLADLPAKPTEDAVSAALVRGDVVHPLADPEAGPGPDEPVAAVRVVRGDVGVAITAGGGCVLGARVAGTVSVSRPAGNCTPEAALPG